LAACVAALAAGCGGGGQDTPKATVEKMFKSLKNGDRAQFMACFEATPEQTELLGSMAGVAEASKKLEDCCIKKFGEDAWKKSQSGKQGARPFAEEPPLDKAEVKMDGDKATMNMPGQSQVMNLVKKGSVWKIDAASMAPATSADDVKRAAKMMDAMANALNVAAAEADKSGATMQSVQAKMAEEFMKAMMQMAPKSE
jgi:hypothetical protein